MIFTCQKPTWRAVVSKLGSWLNLNSNTVVNTCIGMLFVSQGKNVRVMSEYFWTFWLRRLLWTKHNIFSVCGKQKNINTERGEKMHYFMFFLHFVVNLDLVDLSEICIMKIYLCVLFHFLNKMQNKWVEQIVSKWL